MTKIITPENQTCSICQRKYNGWGNSAWPINEGRCCDQCNGLVIIRRLERMMSKEEARAMWTKLSALMLGLFLMMPHAQAGQTLDQVNRYYNHYWQQQRNNAFIRQQEYNDRRQQRTLDQIERNTRTR